MQTENPEVRVYRDTTQLQHEHENMLTRVKPMINEMLYPNIPGRATVNEMEELGCSILLLIQEMWDRHLSL
jgi:hypothetical protein